MAKSPALMAKTTITAANLQAVVTDSNVDVLVHCTAGAGVLCFGSESPVADCSPIAAGEKIIVPRPSLTCVFWQARALPRRGSIMARGLARSMCRRLVFRGPFAPFACKGGA